MFEWFSIIGAIIIIIVFVSNKKRQVPDERMAHELWEMLILRNPTEKELQNIVMTSGPLQEKAAQKLLEIGTERESFLIIAIFGKSCDKVGWKKYLKEEHTCIADLRWVIEDSKNPLIKEHASKIILANCRDLLTGGDYERLSSFKAVLRDITKKVPSQKENAELFMVESKEDIIKKLEAV
ncbi:MAG: hypothetical protein WC608_04410 [Parcubacteria group bacterium]